MAKSKKKISLVKRKTAPVKVNKSNRLVIEIKSQIEQARSVVAVTVNQSLTKLYWNIGNLIHYHILDGGRAAYGKEILATVSQELTEEYGAGYTTSSLSRMMNFYQCFTDAKIVATLSQQLSWSHFIELIRLKRIHSACFIPAWQ